MKLVTKSTYFTHPLKKMPFFVFNALMVLWAACLLQSCITSKKLDTWVTAKYRDSLPLQPISNDSITINLVDSFQATDEVANVSKIQDKKLPLVFYWEWHSNRLVMLNEHIAFGKFRQTFLDYSNQSPLKEKLNGKRLELNVSGLPDIFLLENNGWSVLFPFIPILGSENYTIKPYRKNIVIGYRLYDGQRIKKSGVITSPDTASAYQQRAQFSPKSFTNGYLQQYDKNVDNLCRIFVDRLMEELFVYKVGR